MANDEREPTSALAAFARLSGALKELGYEVAQASGLNRLVAGLSSVLDKVA